MRKIHASLQRKAFSEFCQQCLEHQLPYVLKTKTPNDILDYGSKYGFLCLHNTIATVQTDRMTLFVHTELPMRWFLMVKQGRTPLKQLFLNYTCTQHIFSPQDIQAVLTKYKRDWPQRTYNALCVIVHLQTIGTCTADTVLNQLQQIGYCVRLSSRWNESYILQPKKGYSNMERKAFNDINVLDFGNTLRLCGAVFSDRDNKALLVALPDKEIESVSVMQPTRQEWEAIIQQTDFLETQVTLEHNEKVVLRKSRYQVTKDIMWAVWRRDGYACRYCGETEKPLTVDHVILFKNRGPDTEQNLLTACFKCNKKRGDMLYEDWLKTPYYLRVSQRIAPEIVAWNVDVLLDISTIPLRTISLKR